MVHLSLSQSFLVPVAKLAVSLQHASLLYPLFSPPPQHLARLQSTIILVLIRPFPCTDRDILVFPAGIFGDLGRHMVPTVGGVL